MGAVWCGDTASDGGGRCDRLIGTFILGAFTKVANTFGAVAAFIASSGVMVYVKYFVPADHVTIWSYSIISIVCFTGYRNSGKYNLEKK